MFKTYSSSSSLIITSRWFATSRLVAPVSVRLVHCDVIWKSSCLKSTETQLFYLTVCSYWHQTYPKVPIIGTLWGKTPLAGGFHSQRASNAESGSMSWRHYGYRASVVATAIGTKWWRHHFETFSQWLALCEGNPLAAGGFPSQRPMTRSFDVFFDLRLNKRFSKQSNKQSSKQSRRRWFETPLRSLCNGIMGSVSVTGDVLISTGYLSDQRFRFGHDFVCCLDEMIIYEGGDVIGL